MSVPSGLVEMAASAAENAAAAARMLAGRPYHGNPRLPLEYQSMRSR